MQGKKIEKLMFIVLGFGVGLGVGLNYIEYNENESLACTLYVLGLTFEFLIWSFGIYMYIQVYIIRYEVWD